MLKLHKGKLLVLLFLVNSSLMASLIYGDLKPFALIQWWDIVGEGSVSAMVLAWIVFTLNGRPRGAVTNWLTAGLALILVGTFQDIVDEFIKISNAYLVSQIESTLTPIGVSILSVGLFHWHREQQAFNRRERKREQHYRDHRRLDPLTGLGDARFLQTQLSALAEKAHREGQSLALVLLDIDHFDRINQQYGVQEGDRLLRELSEFLLLNLRRCDLLCRYAGDRFAILMPNTGELLAREQARQLTSAVRHFAYKTEQGETLFHTASAGLALTPPYLPDQLLSQATQALLQAKEASAPREAA